MIAKYYFFGQDDLGQPYQPTSHVELHMYLTFRFCLYLLSLCFLLNLCMLSLNIFVHYLMIVVKVICQCDVYIMYCDPTFRFTIDNFQAFKFLL
jgi:hypothetical protein